MDLSEKVAVLARMYAAFNLRDVDGVLALMVQDVVWPNLAAGTLLHGKESLRPYWAGQFAVANPQVTPLEFVPVGDDVVAVNEQAVQDFRGVPLLPLSTAYHRFAFRDGLVSRMQIFSTREQALET